MKPILSLAKSIPFLRSLFCLLLLTGFLAACSDEDGARLSSLEETTLEGESSTVEIAVRRTNWHIAAVTTLEGGTMVGEGNQPLRLEHLGTLRLHWAEIIRDREDALTVRLDDNFYGWERGFIITLALNNGIYRENIVIRQKTCESFYEIESIEYSVGPGDGVTEGPTQRYGLTYIITTGNGEVRPMKSYPFMNISTRYAFKSESEEVSEKWINPEALLVDMLQGIRDGVVVLEEGKCKYLSEGGQYIKDKELREKSFDTEVMDGNKRNEYSATIYCKRLQVSYVLTLYRPGSDVRKVVRGKLIETYPYDCSPIQHVVTDYDGE